MVSGVNLRKPLWQTALVFALAFWLSGSLILDTIMMPVLYSSGMMVEPGFATAGYSIFWVFNRIELLCAALILTACLGSYYAEDRMNKSSQTKVIFASLLLMVALVYTYGLTPQMSALGLQLNLFNPTLEPPILMNSLHVGYWLLEMLKLVVAGWLLKLCYRSTATA